MGGRSVYACTILAVEVQGMNITTIEGLPTGGTLSPVQQAFKNRDQAQCGYCTPGFIMAATALLAENPNPTMDDVREGLSGHICSCGDTKRIVNTVLSV
jgi:aerobic-type carbon monoxide dehydrogenase small subunit (CoxS/CutS family)